MSEQEIPRERFDELYEECAHPERDPNLSREELTQAVRDLLGWGEQPNKDHLVELLAWMRNQHMCWDLTQLNVTRLVGEFLKDRKAEK